MSDQVLVWLMFTLGVWLLISMPVAVVAGKIIRRAQR